jgi:SAM-dependent methyltransferase
LFVQCAGSVRFTADDQRFRKFFLRALTGNWGGPRRLAWACISLIKLDPIIGCWINRAAAAWPARLSHTELLASPLVARLARDELLIGVLKCDLVADIGLERLLTNVRYALLQAVDVHAPDAQLLDFYCALARQCFVNEYVFSLTTSEAHAAQQVRTSLEQALAAKGPCPVWLPVVVGAYFPLHGLANAQALLAQSWPAPVQALLLQQVKEPIQEQEIATTIALLTPIDDEVSRLVRQQYEENPYPRWVSIGQSGGPQLAQTPAAEALDVLIAGCGTGLAAVELIREARNRRVLAIDLSLASLSYAKRMAQSAGITNIEFAQADINRLGSIKRTFDFIDATGVLHHLADPWAGWRLLLSLLRPGGTMGLGLYSALARQSIVAGRALVAERGYRPNPDDIRYCREAITAAEDGSLLKSLSQVDDFFSMSQCRDMLFHAQEHRLSLPEIKSFLEANDLEFIDFCLDPATLQRFTERFPAPSAKLDLDCWHRFEVEAPMTFLGMYRFWVRKPGTATKPNAAA